MTAFERPLFVVFLMFAAIALPFTAGSSHASDAPDISYLNSSSAPAAPPVDYDYRLFSEIVSIMYATEAAHSGIAKVYDIGDSWEKTNGTADRDILAMKISDNVEVEEDEPELLIMALHHAREWPTAEVATELILNLTDAYGSDARLSWLVDNREIWIVPVVNPDGHDYAMTTYDMWRKNRRLNYDGSFGVDLNRNYDGSQNGDPLGEWGGAGTSDLPSSDVYCGEAPFSEPETQAIRDLTQAHDFQIAIDFHTYGGLVLWPWNYVLDLAPDNDDLVRIGTEFAALNGYTPAQGIDLYATTGDSTDWLYGGEDIYAYCIEIGSDQDGFHPPEQDAVLGIINDNLPVALLAAELCGDREERAFDIAHAPVATREYDASGFEFSADITADRGVDVSALSVFYSVNSGAWQEVAMGTTASNDTYTATIPVQAIGSVVDYYFVAHDLGGVELMSPMYAPYEEYTFSVTGVLSDPPTADAGADGQASVGASYQFDGAGSDDDVGIDNYTWTFTDVAAQTLYEVSPNYVFDRPGSFTVTLTVKDAEAQTDADQVVVTVVDDTPPVADAGTDHLVMVGGSVSFEGSLSDDNVAVVSYEWKFVYNGSERTLTGVSPDFTFWTVDEYVVTLNVTDAAGNYDTDTVTVTVEAAAIPEFSGLIVPVTLVMVAFLVLMRRSRSGTQK